MQLPFLPCRKGLIEGCADDADPLSQLLLRRVQKDDAEAEKGDLTDGADDHCKWTKMGRGAEMGDG